MTKPEALSDHELERTLLAALLADNSGFDRLGQLEPDDLADPMHAAVLTAALDLRSENRAVSVTTLRSRFASVPFGDDGSVLDYLKGCEFGGTAPDVGDMAVALRELSQRREIVELGERIAGSVHDHAVGPGTLLKQYANEERITFVVQTVQRLSSASSRMVMVGSAIALCEGHTPGPGGT